MKWVLTLWLVVRVLESSISLPFEPVFSRYLLTATGLFRYQHPTDEELR